MSFFKNALLQFSGWIPLNILKSISPIDIYLPYHHLVSDGNAPHVSHLYQFKSKAQFEKDLDYLLKHFKPLSVDDLVAFVKKERSIARNQFVLTFDDGFKECSTVIAPILYKKGVPAIFFVNNDFIDNKRLFYRLKISLLIEHFLENPELERIYQDHLESTDGNQTTLIKQLKTLDQNKENLIDEIAKSSGFNFENFIRETQPFMNTEDIEELVKMGFNIGGHSLSHPYFSLLQEDDQVKEAVSSTKKIAQQFNQKHLLFSFPHSDKMIAKNVVQKILDNGIDVLFGIQNQLPELQNNMLHRFNAERPEVPLRRQIKAVMLHAAVRNFIGMSQINRI